MTDAGDGRNVSIRLGSLGGEAADQDVPASRVSRDAEVWTHVPGTTDDPSYYDRPVLKEPVWIWSVPTYFAIGGMGGAASVLGFACRTIGRPELRRIAHRTRWLGVLTGASGTALLIHDLGRPSRFLNMLRVFRPSSPMSVGSWVLASYAPAATISALLHERPGILGRFSAAADAGAGVLGIPLAGYTAVLLANSAVPVWSETTASLPGLFMTSGVTAAASVLDLLPMNDVEARVVRRYGLLGKVAEIGFAEAVQRDAERIDRVGRPLREGVSGALWRVAKSLTWASLGLSLVSAKRPTVRRAAGVLGALGTLATRFAVFEAGKASARDPRATFHLQRSQQ